VLYTNELSLFKVWWGAQLRSLRIMSGIKQKS
jgi:hypothetical protein